MQNAHTKQEHKELLGIDKLIASLNSLNDEAQRLKREKVESLIRQMATEIPYAYQIIPNTLADSLLSDAPLKPTDLSLNEAVANFGYALFDAQQKDELITLVKTYLTQRKKTEKAYAEALLPEILASVDLKVFPEKMRPELLHLALSILEKVINEKQLRKIPGYRLESLIALVEPIIYHRMFHAGLDRLRITHHLAFRKFVNAIAQNGYEKIHDDAKLTVIHNEKSLAFTQFAHAITQKAVIYPPLENEHAKLRFLQKDKIIRNRELQNMLDSFLKVGSLKSTEGMLAHHLRIRFNDKLRRNLHQTELNPEIYQNEFTIKQAHDAIFKEVKDDVYAIKFLMATVKTIRQNFHKNYLRVFAKTKELNAIDAAMLDILLGNAVLKTDLITGEQHAIREGGYPKTDVKQIYALIVQRLKAIEQALSGLFSAPLKNEIARVLAELQKVEMKLQASAPMVEEVAVETPPPALAPEIQETIQTAPEPLPVREEITKPQVASITSTLTETAPAPVVSAPEPTPEPVAAKPEPIPEKITPPPLQIPEEEEPVVKLEPLKVQEEPVVKSEPLKVQEEPVVKPEPLKVQEEPTEKIIAKPLEIAAEPEPEPELEFKLEPSKAVTTVHDQATQETLDSGAMIMKNYQLGDFEKPIYSAWKKMTAATAADQATVAPGLMNLSSDNDVKLYVICDLAQQLSSIHTENLSAEQKQILQEIKNQVVQALQDPLAEQNWDYFEGTQRDIIDGKLSALF